MDTESAETVIPSPESFEDNLQKEKQMQLDFRNRSIFLLYIFLGIIIFTAVSIYYTIRIKLFKIPSNLSNNLQSILKNRSSKYFILSVFFVLLTIFIFPLFGFGPPILWVLLNNY
mgnify:CR=1 FL=1